MAELDGCGLMDPFDDDYWAAVAQATDRENCHNCGHEIRPLAVSPTGWTHEGGQWQGIRCQNMLVGATPAGLPE